MTPKEIATRLARHHFHTYWTALLTRPEFEDFVVRAIEEDRATNAPLLAAAEAYREAWHKPGHEDLVKATALLRAATHGAEPKPADFSREPWNV